MLNYATKENVGTISSHGDSSIKENSPKKLIVVLHGILNASDKVDPLIKAIKGLKPDTDIWVPLLPFRNPFSTISPDKIISNLQEDLDKIWNNGQYTSLIIIGHSMGGVYGRALMLKGREVLRNKNSKDTNYWAKCVDRIILLAAVNRGTGLSRHMSPPFALLVLIGTILERLMKFFYLEPTLSSVSRGAKFLTEMRLNWIEEDLKDPLPLTIQLLGSVDDVVGPDDNIDSITGKNFRYLDVPYSGHVSILQMNDQESGIDPVEKGNRKTRKDKLEIALSYTSEELKEKQVRPWDINLEIDSQEKERRESIKDVIFVMHGIRDQGHWTDKIARRVWKIANDSETETSFKRPANSLEKVVNSYGYFGMGPFLIPGIRRKKVAWFMEKYLEARAKYPKAKFSYIGHSHGTYLLAKALETYKQCRFDNVVFAGSIVRENYDWLRLIRNEQVRHVLNFVATYDYVVAWFPSFLGFYNLQDLGGAGHNDFDQANVKGPVYSINYAKGDHGAGKREELWDAIAKFVLMKNELPQEISKFFDNKNELEVLTKDNTLTRILVWILGIFNILIWTTLVTILFIIIPIAIANSWGNLAKFISTKMSFVVSQWGQIGICSLLSIYYVISVVRHKNIRQSTWWWRSFIVFPVSLSLSFCIAMLGVTQMLKLPYFQGLSLPPLEMWSPAALLSWFIFIILVLSKI